MSAVNSRSSTDTNATAAGRRGREASQAGGIDRGGGGIQTLSHIAPLSGLIEIDQITQQLMGANVKLSRFYIVQLQMLFRVSHQL